MARLPVSVRVEPDEHLAGAIARAAAENGRRFPSEILALVEIKTMHPASVAATLTPANVEALAGLLGVDASWVKEVTHPVGEGGGCEFFGTRIRARHREIPIRRVSPRALASAPYVRAMWQLKPIGFDPRTKERLLSTCPVCGVTLGFSRTQGVCFCDKCAAADDLGFDQPTVDLRDFPQPLVEIDDVPALDFVTGLIDPDREVRGRFAPVLDDDLTGLSRGELFDFATAIVGILEQDPERAVTSPAKPTTRADYEKLFTPDRLAQAGRILLDWRSGFDGLCERARATADGRKGFYGVKAELGQVNALTGDRSLTENTRRVARIAVERNMAGSASAVNVRRAEHRGRSDLVTTQEASDRYGIDGRIFAKLRQAEGVTSFRSAGTIKGPVLFVAEEIATIAALKNDLESSSSVGLRLGIPNGAVVQLAEAGLIEKVTGPVLLTVIGKNQYRKSSVDRLVRDIEAKIGNTPQNLFHIRLTKAMYRLPPGEKPWVALIQAILQERLQVFVVKGRLSATLIKLAAPSFEAVTAAVRHDAANVVSAEPTVTRAEAADILGVTIPTVMGMVTAGLIPVQGPGFGSLKRSDVMAVAETYITTAEISRLIGVGYRWVRGRLAEKGIAPLVELRKSRGLIYGRAQVTGCVALSSGKEAA